MCLASRNHFHIVVQTPLPNFGQGMQRLLGAYAAYFNRRYDRPGHLAATVPDTMCTGTH